MQRFLPILRTRWSAFDWPMRGQMVMDSRQITFDVVVTAARCATYGAIMAVCAFAVLSFGFAIDWLC